MCCETAKCGFPSGRKGIKMLGKGSYTVINYLLPVTKMKLLLLP